MASQSRLGVCHRRLRCKWRRTRISDAINLDIATSVRPDVACDLDSRPWPFLDSQFSEVFAYDVIEHCDNVIATMEEIHRVSTDGAMVHITVPRPYLTGFGFHASGWTLCPSAGC